MMLVRHQNKLRLLNLTNEQPTNSFVELDPIPKETSYCLLNSLIDVPGKQNFESAVLNDESLEKKFVVSCFDSTIGNPAFRVHNVESLFNREVSRSFMVKYERVLRANPTKSVKDIIKFLFIGTKAKDPKVEARKDDLGGFRVVGPYGTGVYLSELASLVNADAFPNANANPRTILFCAVIVGDYCSLPP